MAASGSTTHSTKRARGRLGREEPEWELDGIRVPGALVQGSILTKISEKKKDPKVIPFRLDADQGRLLWDSRKRGVVNVENIKEFRLGASARAEISSLLPSDADVADVEKRWLTIVYTIDDEYKNLHLIAPTEDDHHQWYTTLSQLRRLRLDFMSGVLHPTAHTSELWNRHHFAGADASQDKRLDFAEVKKLCRRLNLGAKEDDLKRRFEEADAENNGTLSYAEFRDFVRKLRERADVAPIYNELKGNGEFTFQVFEVFMKNCQKSRFSSKKLRTIFLQFTPSPPSASQAAQSSTGDTKSTSWTLDSFIAFLSSSYNHPFTEHITPEPSSASSNTPASVYQTKVYQDMTQPLSSYYICSSHNTYLVGNQLVGTSSVEGYIRALLGGCRSVELDLYDGPDASPATSTVNAVSTEIGNVADRIQETLAGDAEATESKYKQKSKSTAEKPKEPISYTGIIPGEPVVTHGGTLTSSLSVRHVCEAINRYAFVTSPYPIIISGELHCSVPQQKVLVEVMREVFGDKLVVAPIDPHDPGLYLPSPEALKGRILLKTKNKILDAQAKEQGTLKEDETESEEELDHGTGKEKDESWTEEIGHKASSMMKRVFGRGGSWGSEKDQKEATSRPSTPSKLGSSTPSRKAPQRSSWISPKKGQAQTAVVKNPEPKEPTQTAVETTTPNGKVLMAPEIIPLLVYTSGVSFRGLSPNAGYAPSHLFSLSEYRAKSIIQNPRQSDAKDMLKPSEGDSTLLVNHTKGHLVRVYPKGTRVDSSNYEPNDFWAMGCQLVTLNWQTVDRGWHINRSMFLRNGGAGYILKPPALLDPSYPSDQTTHRLKKRILNVCVISAQQLPRPKDSQGHEIVDKDTVDPYVKVTIHIPIWASSQSGDTVTPVPVAPAQEARPAQKGGDKRKGRAGPAPVGGATSKSSSPEGWLSESGQKGDEEAGSAVGERVVKAKTDTIRNNGFNPIWDEKLTLPFDVFGEGMEDLIFVRFLVKDDNMDGDEFVGGYCTGLGSLEMGYRHIPLYDGQVNQILFASLFVHLSIEEC